MRSTPSSTDIHGSPRTFRPNRTPPPRPLQPRPRAKFSCGNTRIDAAFTAMLESVPDNPARAAGIALGEKVEAPVFADRQNDATNAPDTYCPLTRPGVWVPTTPPLFSQYATAKPWGLKTAGQFRPGPPPELSSALYAHDYNETKEFGGV